MNALEPSPLCVDLGYALITPAIRTTGGVEGGIFGPHILAAEISSEIADRRKLWKLVGFVRSIQHARCLLLDCFLWRAPVSAAENSLRFQTVCA